MADVLRLRSTLPRPRFCRSRVGGLEGVLSPRGYSADGSRRRRGCETIRGDAAAARRFAATPRLRDDSRRRRGCETGPRLQDGSRRRRGCETIRGDAAAAVETGERLRFLGRPETNEVRCLAMGILGTALSANQQPKDALPALEAYVALNRRYNGDANAVIAAQTNLTNCLTQLGRRDEALALSREIYENRAAMLGASHEDTILSGVNLSSSLRDLGRFDEVKSLVRDKLLPAARQTLGADHNFTLKANQRLIDVLVNDPKRTRDDPAFESTCTMLLLFSTSLSL